MRTKRFAAFVLAATVLCLTSVVEALELENVGEGSVAGYVPVRADTVSDTGLYAGDTVYFDDGTREVILSRYEREEATFPSARTQVKILAGDGFAHGKVVQVFHNPFDLPFEATYIFPLPHDGAVHAMEFTTGTGVYHADLKEKEEAKKEYEQAKREGKQASLLLQSQDNIFVQKLCNIPPHDSVSVTISFSMALTYDMGTYELAFPTVVGPRYDPAPLPKRRSNPAYVPPSSRSGSTLDFAVLILTPYELDSVRCVSHEVEMGGVSAADALAAMALTGQGIELPEGVNPSLVRLARRQTIPNKDIVVRFKRKSTARDLSVLSWHDGEQGYFAMNLYPDLRESAGEVRMPIDMVFVLDVSGSMGGQPIAKLKAIMHAMLDKAKPQDRLSFIAFSTGTSNFHEQPIDATAENIAAARNWIDNLNAGGGTNMLAGVRKALDVPLSPERLRIMSLITDGYIGGIRDIYEAIDNDPNGTIAFTFGVGSSVNRELMDLAATAGDGIARTVLLSDNVEPIVDDFWSRIRTPQLANISLSLGEDIDGLTLDTIPNLWLGQPIRMFGRYTDPGTRRITLSAVQAGTAVNETYTVPLVNTNTLIQSVPAMWARETIENLRNDQYAAGDEHNKMQILEISLAFNVLCEYTAFIAVADSVVNEDGELVSAEVPVPVPEGVDGDAAGAQYASSSGSSGSAMEAVRENGQAGEPHLRFRLEHRVLHATLAGITPADLQGSVKIYDMKGRVIRSWTLAELAANNFTFTWDFTDSSGRRVAASSYLLRVSCPSLTVNRILALR